MTRLAAILACAAVLLVVAGEARAQTGAASGTKSAQAAKPEPAKPEETKPEPSKPETTEPAKPEESAAPTPEAGPEAAPDANPVALGELTKEGFKFSFLDFGNDALSVKQLNELAGDLVKALGPELEAASKPAAKAATP